MSVRRTVAGALTGALVTSALLAANAPSAHAVEPDDTTFTPVAADLIGVGSDTSQHAVWALATAWNAKTPAPAFKVASFAATGGGTIALPSGAITRPNGSGAGKNLLHGGTNNVDVDFARSSSSLSTGEVSDGLQQIPFAVDELAMAVSKSTVSNAPVSLTPAQIVGIYKGEITNWSQVGGTAGVIAPKIPQGGSGTRSFFVAQLKALNGGVDVALAASVAEVQEHDDSLVKNDPNAIAPFSVGRAGLLGDTLRIETGWSAKRALYNVVRGADVADAKVQAVFGASGFFCSDAARTLIRDSGFKQLATDAKGGVCGEQTQDPTSNFTVNPANADDTDFAPVSGDLIGVGSDTSQHAVFSLATAWNAKTPAPAYRVSTFAATGGGTIALPSGAITRPNGSGAGKNLLHGGTNNVDVDFARSSSSLSTGEVSDGLQQIPFAVDELAMAVSKSTVSNAPVSLTPAQIVGIYKGEITNWSQVGGTAGVIAPKIPQGGSGTRSFFVAQLKALNGGVDVALAASVAEVQEHDDSLVKNDPNAIAPFSVGRAGLLGDTLRIETGWSAKRALYNVVRGADVADAKVQAVFGPTGFVCSDAARAPIEAAGFKQLDSEADGGVCGEQTQDPTTNFTYNGHEEAVVTTATTLEASSTTPGQVVLTATVSSDPAAQGTVTFKEGTTVLQADVALDGTGHATKTLTGVSGGSHTYTAVFVPADGFAASEDDATVEVATPAVATTVNTAATSPSARRVNLKATVAPTGAAGTVTFRDGSTVVATGVAVVSGVATKVLTSVKPGTHKYAAQFVPTSAAAFTGSTDATPASVLVRTTAVITESFPATVAKGARARGVVAVALSGTTTKASGKVVVTYGSKVVGSGTLSNGRVTLTLAKLTAGRKTLVITWSGNSLAPKTKKSFVLTQK